MDRRPEHAPAPRRLLLLRHAAAADAPGQPDHERPLTPAGRAQAARLGGVVATHAPDLVLCSSARRARETVAALGLDGCVAVADDLYLAPAQLLLALVRAAPDDATSVLVVAHNPGIARLAATLGDDPRLGGGFPPATLAVFAPHASSWAQLGSARLLDLVRQ